MDHLFLFLPATLVQLRSSLKLVDFVFHERRSHERSLSIEIYAGWSQPVVHSSAGTSTVAYFLSSVLKGVALINVF